MGFAVEHCGILAFTIFHLAVVEGGVFCEGLYGEITYCTGLTAHCCELGRDVCCWEVVWRTWWFWIVTFIIICSFVSCLGYFCTSSDADGYNIMRNESIMRFTNRFRRNSSMERELEQERKRLERAVLLPPYTPSVDTTSISPPYNDPPPPYSGSEIAPSLTETSSATTSLTTRANNTPTSR